MWHSIEQSLNRKESNLLRKEQAEIKKAIVTSLKHDVEEGPGAASIYSHALQLGTVQC